MLRGELRVKFRRRIDGCGWKKRGLFKWELNGYFNVVIGRKKSSIFWFGNITGNIL